MFDKLKNLIKRNSKKIERNETGDLPEGTEITENEESVEDQEQKTSNSEKTEDGVELKFGNTTSKEIVTSSENNGDDDIYDPIKLLGLEPEDNPDPTYNDIMHPEMYISIKHQKKNEEYFKIDRLLKIGGEDSDVSLPWEFPEDLTIYFKRNRGFLSFVYESDDIEATINRKNLSPKTRYDIHTLKEKLKFEDYVIKMEYEIPLVLDLKEKTATDLKKGNRDHLKDIQKTLGHEKEEDESTSRPGLISRLFTLIRRLIGLILILIFVAFAVKAPIPKNLEDLQETAPWLISIFICFLGLILLFKKRKAKKRKSKTRNIEEIRKQKKLIDAKEEEEEAEEDEDEDEEEESAEDGNNKKLVGGAKGSQIKSVSAKKGSQKRKRIKSKKLPRMQKKSASKGNLLAEPPANLFIRWVALFIDVIFSLTIYLFLSNQEQFIKILSVINFKELLSLIKDMPGLDVIQNELSWEQLQLLLQYQLWPEPIKSMLTKEFIPRIPLLIPYFKSFLLWSLGTIVIFGVTGGQFLSGIKATTGFLQSRFWGPIRFIIGLVTLPFILFDLPPLIGRRSLKEFIIPGHFTHKGSNKFIKGVFVYFPIIIIFLFIHPLFPNFNSVIKSVQHKYITELPSPNPLTRPKVEMPYRSDYFRVLAAFNIEDSLIWLPHFEVDKMGLHIGAHIIDSDAVVYGKIMIRRNFEWKKFLNQMPMEDPLLTFFRPELFNYLTSDAPSYNNEVEGEFQDLVISAFGLGIFTAPLMIPKIGPFINASLNFRKSILSSYWPEYDYYEFNKVVMGNYSFLNIVLQSKNSSKRKSIYLPFNLTINFYYEVEYDSNKTFLLLEPDKLESQFKNVYWDFSLDDLRQPLPEYSSEMNLFHFIDAWSDPEIPSYKREVIEEYLINQFKKLDLLSKKDPAFIKYLNLVLQEYKKQTKNPLTKDYFTKTFINNFSEPNN